MKILCRMLGHKDHGIRRVEKDHVTCFCSRCGELFEYEEVNFFDDSGTSVFIPKGAIDVEEFRKAWEEF